MERRAKVALFEQIRREYEFGVGTIRAVAHKLGGHRRMVRQALARAEPPQRKRVTRERPAIGPAPPGKTVAARRYPSHVEIRNEGR